MTSPEIAQQYGISKQKFHNCKSTN